MPATVPVTRVHGKSSPSNSRPSALRTSPSSSASCGLRVNFAKKPVEVKKDQLKSKSKGSKSAKEQKGPAKDTGKHEKE